MTEKEAIMQAGKQAEIMCDNLSECAKEFRIFMAKFYLSLPVGITYELYTYLHKIIGDY